MRTRDYLERKAAVLSRVAEDLTPGYDCDGGRNPIASCGEHPSEAEIIRLLALLDDVFYPGYRTRCAPGEPVEAMVVERLDEAYDLLTRQVKLALPLRWKSEAARAGDPVPSLEEPALQAEAERVVGEFLGRLPQVRERLKQDVVAAYNGDPAARSHTEIILSYPSIRTVTAHRVAHELYRLDVPLIPRLMGEHLHRRTGIEIHPGARIGESFFIDHGTGVVIGETTVIEDRVKLYQGVTLGAFSFKLDASGHPVKGGKRHPTLEDDVVIYAGATILGGDTVIGRGAVVGSNVWLTRSVPPGATVTQKNANQF